MDSLDEAIKKAQQETFQNLQDELQATKELLVEYYIGYREYEMLITELLKRTNNNKILKDSEIIAFLYTQLTNNQKHIQNKKQWEKIVIGYIKKQKANYIK